MNLALAAFFLCFLVPVALFLGAVEPTSARVLLVLVSLPFVLLTVLCLASALRPGCLGRAAKKARARRASKQT